MNDSFSSMHPVTPFFFFTVAILMTMFMMHPAFLAVSFVSASAYHLYLKGVRSFFLELAFLIPFILLMSFANALFNHQGVTRLFYSFDGNPVTLEAVLFGIAAALMCASVMLWFSCYNVVMTTDKFLYLFGRIIPALSLILSMALRFVPRFTQQIKKINAAQKMVGMDLSEGNIFHRMRCAVRIMSSAITWALESGIIAADSMKSRGYGTSRRTNFSIYYFDGFSKGVFGVLILLAFGIISMLSTGFLYIRYYPSIRMNDNTPLSVLCILFYSLFCFMPVIVNLKEDMTWRRLRSKI